MPRPHRVWSPGQPYHVIARTNGGVEAFQGPADYAGFLALLGEALEREAGRALAWCLMPNHAHLVLRPAEGADLGRLMQWLLRRHASRRNRRAGAAGNLWRTRFRAFPAQDDRHLLTVLRYVERNARRAGLVERAADWPWGSLARRGGAGPDWFERLDLPAGWAAFVDAPQTAAELEALRRSVNRGTPFGGPDWVRAAAASHGLGASLRPRGRPKKVSDTISANGRKTGG